MTDVLLKQGEPIIYEFPTCLNCLSISFKSGFRFILFSPPVSFLHSVNFLCLSSSLLQRNSSLFSLQKKWQHQKSSETHFNLLSSLIQKKTIETFEMPHFIPHCTITIPSRTADTPFTLLTRNIAPSWFSFFLLLSYQIRFFRFSEQMAVSNWNDIPTGLLNVQ